jgi:hypothetical protein
MFTIIAAALTFAQVCQTTYAKVLPKQFLYKSELSTHITGPDVRKEGPTLVCGSVCPTSWPAEVYYSDGSLATRLGYYGTYAGNGKPRAYCGVGGVPKCNNRKLARDSTRKLRDGYLYLKTKPGTCYRVNVVGRTGSV